ncbi:MAG: hypothetical protein KF897_04030 [Opitutaceae bacterium]|nr:hypothetical protein [Opitutaceae bacterium]
MGTTVRRRLAAVVLGLLGCTAAAWAQQPAGGSVANGGANGNGGAEPKISDDELRIRGVFDTALPGVEKKNRLKLIIHPHFGDLHRKDYLRAPLGLRYGLTERWEVTGEVETYFAHGLGEVPFLHKEGISNYHFNTKYNLGRNLWRGWDTGVGFDYITPAGTPPEEISDGLEHRAYFVTFSRHLESRPDIRVFWGLNYDTVSETGLPVMLDDNELGDDNVSVNAGIVWQRPKLTYTFETTLATTRVVGDLERDVVTIRPGIVWPIPQRYTFRKTGQWLLGMAPRVSFGPDGAVFGVNVKLRGSFDFKRWIRSKFRGKPPAPAP